MSDPSQGRTSASWGASGIQQAMSHKFAEIRVIKDRQKSLEPFGNRAGLRAGIRAGCRSPKDILISFAVARARSKCTKRPPSPKMSQVKKIGAGPLLRSGPTPPAPKQPRHRRDRCRRMAVTEGLRMLFARRLPKSRSRPIQNLTRAPLPRLRPSDLNPLDPALRPSPAVRSMPISDHPAVPDRPLPLSIAPVRPRVRREV